MPKKRKAKAKRQATAWQLAVAENAAARRAARRPAARALTAVSATERQVALASEAVRTALGRADPGHYLVISGKSPEAARWRADGTSPKAPGTLGCREANSLLSIAAAYGGYATMLQLAAAKAAAAGGHCNTSIMGEVRYLAHLESPPKWRGVFKAGGFARVVTKRPVATCPPRLLDPKRVEGALPLAVVARLVPNAPAVIAAGLGQTAEPAAEPAEPAAEPAAE